MKSMKTVRIFAVYSLPSILTELELMQLQTANGLFYAECMALKAASGTTPSSVTTMSNFRRNLSVAGVCGI